jgi:hypothetical protein
MKTLPAMSMWWLPCSVVDVDAAEFDAKKCRSKKRHCLG